jgi:hypothetical protein
MVGMIDSNETFGEFDDIFYSKHWLSDNSLIKTMVITFPLLCHSVVHAMSYDNMVVKLMSLLLL